MSAVQIIEKNGRPEWAVIPYTDYQRLLELVADAQDIRDIELFHAALDAGQEELVPAEIADRILDGESPLRVWREHRRMTQQTLAHAAGVGKSYVSQIESGRKTGTVETLSRLAQALEVDLDDLAPATTDPG